MYCFIINRGSANGKGSKVWKNVEKILKNTKISYDTIFTEPDSKIIIPDNKYHTIVIIGGDGTINAVIRAIVNKRINVGVIPAGSGNDFARAMDIPLHYKAALERVLTSTHKQSIDLISVDDNQFCITVLGVGFDALVTKVTNESVLKKWLGKLSYFFCIFKVLFQYKPTTVTLTINNVQETFYNVWLIAIANLPYYGGGLYICPSAKKNDGLLDLCIVHGVSLVEIIRVLPKVFSGKHIFHPSVTLRKGKNIKIHSNSPLIIQGDGEIVGETPAIISVKKNALQVL